MSVFHSLTAKILSVNLLALLIIVVGILYVDRYQEDILKSELDRLESETALFAGALRESVISISEFSGPPASPVLALDRPGFNRIQSRRLVENLAEKSSAHIRLFELTDDSKVQLLADSQRRGRSGEYIEIEALPPTPDLAMQDASDPYAHFLPSPPSSSSSLLLSQRPPSSLPDLSSASSSGTPVLSFGSRLFARIDNKLYALLYSLPLTLGLPSAQGGGLEQKEKRALDKGRRQDLTPEIKIQSGIGQSKKSRQPGPDSYPYLLIDELIQKQKIGTIASELKGVSAAWRDGRTGVSMAAAQFVEDGNLVAGVLLVSRPGLAVRKAVAEMRLELVKMSLIALLATLTLSLYLSRVIGTPLRRLAGTARRIRKERKILPVPSFPRRKDEIGELSRAMREMTDALADRLDAIENFAGDVSHELKNPLTSLRSALETLDSRLSTGKQDADVQELMRILLHDVERMNRLVNDIASISRLDVALEREQRIQVDLSSLLVRVIDLYAKVPRWNQAGIILDIWPGTERYDVWGNEERLAQVIRNLIDNALSFSPPDTKVRVALSREGKDALIEVCDEGPGIPDDRREKIFERFYSERPGHEAYGEHSGLGLAICRQIITSHRGRIEAVNRVEAEQVKGACFMIRLPLAL